MKTKFFNIVRVLCLSIFGVGVVSATLAQSELPKPSDIEFLKPELVSKLNVTEKQNYIRTKNNVLINQWLVDKSAKAMKDQPRRKVIFETLGDGYFENFLRLSKAEYQYQIAVIKERHAETQDEREELRDKRLFEEKSLEMVRSQLKRRHEIVLEDIPSINEIKEEDRKAIIEEKELKQGSVVYFLVQKVLAGFLGYSAEQLSLAIKNDLKVQIESGKGKQYEIVSRTPQEVVVGGVKESVKITVEGKTSEQVVDEILKTSNLGCDTRRLFIKEIEESGTSRAWSYDTGLALKYSEGEVLDLLAPPKP